MLAAQVANGGHRVRPYLVESVRDLEGHVVMRRGVEGQTGTLGLPPSEIQQLRDAMEACVMDAGGTGYAARVPGIRIAGKTGTAQNPHGLDHAVFMGYAPADDPRIALAIVIENGGHGASAAAPVARRVIAALLAPQALTAEERAGTDSTAASAPVDTSAAD